MSIKQFSARACLPHKRQWLRHIHEKKRQTNKKEELRKGRSDICQSNITCEIKYPVNNILSVHV